MHPPVIVERVHGPGFGFRWFDETQRLGNRHLIDHDLIGMQRRFRDPVTGLDDRRLRGTLGGFDACGAGEKAPDRDGVGGVVGALVDDLEHVFGTENRGGQLHAAGAPAIGQRHFTAAKWHLITGNRHGLEQAATDHAFGLFVQISEVVRLIPARARLRSGIHWACSLEGLRSLRISSSSAWKST